MDAEKKEKFLFFGKGLLMGIADSVPGISGGTIALLTGIYERLIKGIKNVNIKWFIYFMKFFFTARTSALLHSKKEFKRIDWYFFIPLVIGIFIGLYSMAHVLSYLLASHKASTLLFFVGAIGASVSLLFKRITRPYANSVIGGSIIIGLVIALIVPTQTPAVWWMWIISGFVAISAMLLPGVSGSYILLLLGKYDQALEVLKSPWSHISILILFGIGIIIGLYIMSRVISYLLAHHHHFTIQALIGLVIGSLAMPLSQIMPVYTHMSLLFLVIGAAIPLILHAKLSKTL